MMEFPVDPGPNNLDYIVTLKGFEVVQNAGLDYVDFMEKQVRDVNLRLISTQQTNSPNLCTTTTVQLYTSWQRHVRATLKTWEGEKVSPMSSSVREGRNATC